MPINPRPLQAALLAAVILAEPLFSAPPAADGTDPGPGEVVRVGILSKYLLQMKKGILDSLVFTFTGETFIEGRGEGFLGETRRLEIRFRGGRFHVSAGKEEYASLPLRLGAPVPSRFTVMIGKETRSYPLPLEIEGDGEDARIVVTEELSRYSRDSSLAEFGDVPVRFGEAAEAVSMLIESRYHRNKKNPSHGGFDFCDLTHCQVYRGKLPWRFAGKPAGWRIDPGKMPAMLPFHSRCGGHTLDGRVFGGNGKEYPGVRDWIHREGIYLCRGAAFRWENALSGDELADIFGTRGSGDISLAFDHARLRVILGAQGKTTVFPPEDFRLRINRVKGWNFIKSNNYSVRQDPERRVFVFSGEGLGHGAGLCQHGALALAGLGYTRYEILEHYFPDICLRGKDTSPSPSPYLSWTIFSLRTGNILSASHAGAGERKLPAGSLFKLVVSAYLAAERGDLLRDYRFSCAGRNDGNPDLPERCWDPRGHGENDFSGALSRSCNLYFASLYERIRYNDFRSFCGRFFRELGMKAELPDVKSGREEAALLAGLDFSVKFSVRDLMILARFLSPAVTAEPGMERLKESLPTEARKKIGDALAGTLVKGTASGEVKPYGPMVNFAPLLRRGARKGFPPGMWGKTSTVVGGSNVPQSYGLFMGGDEERGIVVVLRKGNGHLAAKWAGRLLENHE